MTNILKVPFEVMQHNSPKSQKKISDINGKHQSLSTIIQEVKKAKFFTSFFYPETLNTALTSEESPNFYPSYTWPLMMFNGNLYSFKAFIITSVSSLKDYYLEKFDPGFIV